MSKVDKFIKEKDAEMTKYTRRKTAAVNPTQGQLNFLDQHLGEGETDWGKFTSRLRSKGFVKAVEQDPRSDEKMRRYARAMHSLDQGDVVAKVPSMSGGAGRYRIKQLPTGRLGCTCNDWKYNRSVNGGDCKHVRAFKAQMKKTASAGEFIEKHKGVLAPAGAAAAVGLGTFAALRRKKLSPQGTLLRTIQDKSKGRMVRVLPDTWRGGDPGAPGLFPWWGKGKPPGVMERLINRAMYGAETLYSDGKKVKDIFGRTVATPQKPLKVDGAVWHYDPRDANLVKGTISPTTLVPEKDIIHLEDKLHQARLVEKAVPGAVPRTEKLPKVEAPQLMGTLQEKFPQGFIVKKRVGTARGEGVFLHNKIKQDHLKMFADRPDDYIVQELQPLTSEWRVHVIDGKAIEGAASRRFFRSKGSKEELQAAKELAEKVSKNMPGDYRKALLGPDIGVVKQPGKKPKAFIIETNAAGERGGQSGFVDWYINPRASGAMHKVFTGRTDPTRATAAAAIGGTAAGLGAHQAIKKTAGDQETGKKIRKVVEDASLLPVEALAVGTATSLPMAMIAHKSEDPAKLKKYVETVAAESGIPLQDVKIGKPRTRMGMLLDHLAGTGGAKGGLSPEGKGRIHATANVPEALHELGHVKHFQKGTRFHGPQKANIIDRAAHKMLPGMYHKDVYPITKPWVRIGKEVAADAFMFDQLRKTRGMKAAVNGVMRMSPGLVSHAAAASLPYVVLMSPLMVAAAKRRAKMPEVREMTKQLEGLEKTAESKVWQDFLAGIDPTGTKTFQFGLHNVDKHQLHRAAGIAGGFAGGATVVPSAVMGLVGGLKGAATASGGVSARAAGAARGAWRGAKKPLFGTMEAIKAQRILANAAKNGTYTNTEANRKVLQSVGKQVPVGAFQEAMKDLTPMTASIQKEVGNVTQAKGLRNKFRAAQAAKVKADRAADKVTEADMDTVLDLAFIKPGETVQLSDKARSAAGKAAEVARSRVAEGVAVLALGGAINSLSASMQYQHARETAEKYKIKG